MLLNNVPKELDPTPDSGIAPVFCTELNETETDGHVDNNWRKDVSRE